MSKTSKGCLFVIAAALCWSCGGVFLKFIDADIWMISSIRYLTGFIGIVLLSRSLPVFFIRDQEGKLRNKDNESMKPEDIMEMGWVLENVIGTIPAIEELVDDAHAVVALKGVEENN